MIAYVHFLSLECVTDMSQRWCGEAARLQGWPMSEEWHRGGDEHFKELIVPETWASLCTSSGLPRQNPFMCVCVNLCFTAVQEEVSYSTFARCLIYRTISGVQELSDTCSVKSRPKICGSRFPDGSSLLLVREIKGWVDLWKSWNSWMINFWPC